jgi:protein O-GlcNAc transferase
MTPQETQSAMQSAAKLIRDGRFPGAETIYRQILAENPNHSDALHWLGFVLYSTNRFDEAESVVRRELAVEPTRPDTQCNLAVLLTSQGKYNEAIAICRKLIADHPELGEAHDNLARTLRLTGHLDQATAAYKQGIDAAPKYAPNYVHLAQALYDKGQPHEALAAARQALVVQPDYPDAYFQLGFIFRGIWRLDESLAAYEKAVALRPYYPEALLNLGIVQWNVGRVAEACETFRRSIVAGNVDGYAHSNLILAMHYRDDITPQNIAGELKAWNKTYAEPLQKFIRPLNNDRNPDRPLRVGYISPDFRGHPVGRFIAPLLIHHDHNQFQIYCYSDTKQPDGLTERLRASSHAWRETREKSPSEIAEMVRNDGIDILVDLTLHTEHHRLLAFAQKPAPVQVTYLGYCGSSGLATMDYRLSDPYFDPPGIDESQYSEKTIRLPQTYWCFEPLSIMPDVQPLPALRTSQITFGCLNNYCKVSNSAWNTWAKLLQAVPNSRLIVFSGEGAHRDIAKKHFAAQGIDPARLVFNTNLPMRLYFASYHKIDIALDPFPFNGGATTCDSLWMGVPVITLKGQNPVARAGSSILSNVGLPHLIAESPDHYINIAKDLAADLPSLANLRKSLRPQMQSSPLMNAPAFAKAVEDAYRQMWKAHCAK